MAQEVEAVMPNLVIKSMLPPKRDSVGNILVASAPVKMINYIGIIPLLVEGYKEQSQKIDSLVTLVNNLQQTLNNCCISIGHSLRNSNSIDVELSSGSSIILNQNDPNPFAEKTTITFSIPEEVNKAQIIFYDNLGRILKTVVVNERGDSQLNVFASNLSDGIYSYSLIADGKLIATKKMVKGN